VEQRILIYTNHYDPEYFKINDIVRWISEKDFIISVITGNPNYPSGKLFDGFSPFGSKKVEKKGLTVYRLPLITRGKAGYLRLLINYISYFVSLIFFTFWCILFHKKYETIFIHHTSPPLMFLPAIFYKKIKKAKLIVWDLDMWPHTLEAIGIIKSKRLIKIFEFIFMSFYKSFDKILIASKSFEIIAKKRIQNSKIDYFPNWADKEFESLNLETLSPKKNDNIVITYTGNIGEAQGFESLIEAIKISKNKKIKFNFVGTGRYKFTLGKLIEKNKLESQITLIDPVSSKDLIRYFKKTHYLYVSLKKSSIFFKTVPAKLQTYLAIGKPIISSISGESKDILKLNNCGPNTDAGDIKGLVQIFNNINKISDREYKQFSRNTKKLYNERFSSLKRRSQLFNLLIDKKT